MRGWDLYLQLAAWGMTDGASRTDCVPVDQWTNKTKKTFVKVFAVLILSLESSLFKLTEFLAVVQTVS